MTVYLLRTSGDLGRPLEAWSLAELAELVECALAAGDQILRLGAWPDRRGLARPLTAVEVEQVLALIAA